MTHPPGGPITAPPPSGPRAPKSDEFTCFAVEPLDPDSPIGRQIAEDLTQVLAEIELQIQQRDGVRGRAA